MSSSFERFKHNQISSLTKRKRKKIPSKTNSQINPSMETRSAKRKKLLHADIKSQEDQDQEDRISDLPEAVLHKILLLLPIKTIAQTSILSKRWKNLWYAFPDLDFTSLFLPTPTSSEKVDVLRKFGNAITRFLPIRDKHSDLRTLRFRACFSFSGLNKVIRTAVRQNVQEIDIEVFTHDYFNFPRSLVSSNCIRVLKLRSYAPGFRLPPSSVMKSGFRNLHTLSLSSVIVSQQTTLIDMFTSSSFPSLKKLRLNSCFRLRQLSISCKNLEDLELEGFYHLNKLKISCPKLEWLKVKNGFDAFGKNNFLKLNLPRLQIIDWSQNAPLKNCVIKDLTSLREVSIGLLAHHEDFDDEMLSCLSKFLSGLSGAEFLSIECRWVEMLSMNNLLARTFRRPFVNVKSLELHTDYIPALSNILSSSPILQTLVIKISGAYKGERKQWHNDMWTSSSLETHWESQSESLKPLLQYLKFVKIYSFLECEDDITLVKFLLKHGRVLQEIILYSGNLHPKGLSRRENIRSRMMGFSRASSNAKLVFSVRET